MKIEKTGFDGMVDGKDFFEFPDGGIVINIPGDYNKPDTAFVLTYGNFDDLQINEVFRINVSTNTEIEDIKEALNVYKEYFPYDSAYHFIQASFGDEIFSRRTLSDSLSFEEYENRARSGKDGRKNLRNTEKKSLGRGNSESGGTTRSQLDVDSPRYTNASRRGSEINKQAREERAFLPGFSLYYT